MSGHYKPELLTQAQQDEIETEYGEWEPWYGCTYPDWKQICADIDALWAKEDEQRGLP